MTPSDLSILDSTESLYRVIIYQKDMKRRTALKQFGATSLIGVTGCVRPPTASSEDSLTESEGVRRRVSIAHQASIPDEYQLQIEARMLETTITESQTARIQISVRNDGPPRGIQVSPTGRCALFHKSSQSSKPRGIWLASVEESAYTSGPDWIASPPEDGSFPDYGCGLHAYDTGDSVQNEYDIYHDGRTKGFLNPGTYRFQEPVFATPGESHDVWDRDAKAAFSVPWSVSITLKG